MMSRTARLLTVAAGLLLLVLYVAPLWRITLVAPQYPEGLGMQIHINTVRGVGPNDLANINGLNHYIGMRHIEPDAIPVLRVIPWVVAILVAGGVLTAVVGRRALLYGWLGAFLVAGLVGMVTFWWWEYDYGHHLDVAQAIIKVPGMSYQPPLLGSRQILNFTATSYPAIGSWLASVAFMLGASALLAGCRTGPRAIAFGKDECRYCHMLITDSRYAAEIVTPQGRDLTFDSIECAANYVLTLDPEQQRTVGSVWVADYANPGTLIPAGGARFLRAAGTGSPMGRGMLAIGPDRQLASVGIETSGPSRSWTEVLQLAQAEHWSTQAPAPGRPELQHATP